VGVPIETVAILGRRSMHSICRARFDKAPTYEAGRNTALEPDEMIKIALGRR
jgi:hypothetical protein